MYYKILKNGKIIDAVARLQYVRAPAESKRVLLCSCAEASGILSEDGTKIWHLEGFYPFQVGDYETVEIRPIEEKEYHQIKALNGSTPEEIIDEYTLYLIEEGLL